MLRYIAMWLMYPCLMLLPPKKGIVYLTFHNILDDDFSWFEAVIEFLNKKYRIISPQDIYEVQNQNDNEIKIVLTFDDGFLSNKKLYESILKKYEIRAIFFITSDFIDVKHDNCLEYCKATFLPALNLETADVGQYLPMSWEDLRFLRSQGNVIGAHSRSHIRLTDELKQSELYEEIVRSADALERKIDCPVNGFAFPFGSITDFGKRAYCMATNRFDFIFSNIRGNYKESPSNSFIFRQNLRPSDPLWFVQICVEGRVDWIYSCARDAARRLFSDVGVK